LILRAGAWVARGLEIYHGFSKGETSKKKTVEKVIAFFDSQFKKAKT